MEANWRQSAGEDDLEQDAEEYEDVEDLHEDMGDLASQNSRLRGRKSESDYCKCFNVI